MRTHRFEVSIAIPDDCGIIKELEDEAVAHAMSGTKAAVAQMFHGFPADNVDKIEVDVVAIVQEVEQI